MVFGIKSKLFIMICMVQRDMGPVYHSVTLCVSWHSALALWNYLRFLEWACYLLPPGAQALPSLCLANHSQLIYYLLKKAFPDSQVQLGASSLHSLSTLYFIHQSTYHS